MTDSSHQEIPEPFAEWKSRILQPAINLQAHEILANIQQISPFPIRAYKTPSRFSRIKSEIYYRLHYTWRALCGHYAEDY